MNLRLVISIFSVAAANIIISIPLITYAISQYDTDGFTVFPTKSGDYMVGYRAGVAQAADDVKHFDERGGVDARPEMIKRPRPDLAPDWCLGYKDGYADEAMDQLE